MCDEPTPAAQDRKRTQSRRALTRIADTLGVPVSSFADGAGRGSAIGGLDLDEAALLTLVRAYLRAADPDARGRFVQAVSTMAESGG